MDALAEERLSLEHRRRTRVLEVWRFLRGQVSSLIATLVDWGLMLGLIWSHAHYAWAVAAGHAGGALADFAVKKWWAFDVQGGALREQAGRYAVAWMGSLCLNELIAWSLISVLGQHPAPSVIASALVVALIWNYPMHRWFVFGKRLRETDRRQLDGR